MLNCDLLEICDATIILLPLGVAGTWGQARYSCNSPLARFDLAILPPKDFRAAGSADLTAVGEINVKMTVPYHSRQISPNGGGLISPVFFFQIRVYDAFDWAVSSHSGTTQRNLTIRHVR